MKKFLLVLGVVILVLLMAMGVVLGFYLGPIVKVGMEQLGPKAIQAPVTVQAVDLSLLSGSATVKDLVIGNPQGYASAEAFSVGTIAISLDPLSVTKPKILIHSVHVESPRITYEGRFGASNLSKISDNVNSFVKNNVPASSGPSGDTSANGPSPQANNKPAPKIEVDDFLITGAVVHVNISGLVSKDITLPDIHLTDLGKGSDGLTPAELTAAIMKTISVDTLTAVTTSVSGLKSTFNNTFKQLKNTFGGLLGQ